MLKMLNKKYTSRDRINCAIAHKEPDRVPLDLNGTGSTGIMPDVYRRLRSYMKFPGTSFDIWHTMQQLVEVDEDLLSQLNVDVRRIVPNSPSNWQLKIKRDDYYDT